MDPLRPAALCIVTFVAFVVQAQPAGYEAAYKKGVQEENAGALVDALTSFESIPESARDLNTRFHISSVLTKLNRFLAAERQLEAIRTDPHADSIAIEMANDQLKDLRSRIPVLTLQLAPTTSGVQVLLDGRAIAVPGSARLDPGSHAVVAKRSSEVVFERRVTLPENSKLTVVIDAPAASSPPATSSKVTVAPAREPHGATLSGIPFVVAGGVALLGAGGAFALSALADRDVERNCAQQPVFDCDESAAGASRVRTWRTVSVAAAGVGIVGMAIGVGLETRVSPS